MSARVELLKLFALQAGRCLAHLTGPALMLALTAWVERVRRSPSHAALVREADAEAAAELARQAREAGGLAVVWERNYAGQPRERWVRRDGKGDVYN
jgi:hypothetical protein